ncbi:PLP-dependent transferase [Aaosphaeria arxii CBS 175.79]|uniref:PLP-dependent transferase n=1 Tax=Aaosphaeria arxii CBS 175.79 TaxID=1450172 RepID=A0A6A5XJ67_9PLEO|nr:PLP-dependent transferase [Aaosphaeria arxii CBS 175.79]KAF2012800.1 PLP-dependent transferase [Aaosphaeria arxii CBS 175.79]
MLSHRGQKIADQTKIPWRFALGTTYDRETNPDGRISFATAENFLIQQELEDFANNKVFFPGKAFSYSFSTAGGGPKFPTALAGLLNDYFNPYEPITGKDIRATSAATALHEILAFSLASPGEGVLFSRPYYGRFELDFGNKAQVAVVPADTQAETCFQPDVVDAYEKALLKSNSEGVKIRALLIVNPHNPLGRCYPRETLVALMKFCQKHQIHFISDEVYGLSVFDSGEPDTVPFTSALSINPTDIIDPNLLHVTYAMSKDFGAPGLRIGALISKNEDLKESLLNVIRFHSTSGPSIAIATAMLEDREWVRSFIGKSRERLADTYKFVIGRLNEIGIKYLRGTNAGFFVWIDLSPYLPPESEGLSQERREEVLAQKFIDGGLFLQPHEEHALKPGWFRMVYSSMTRETLELALKRFENVIKA